jgi:uncharacterized delta-60 repeat protein
MILLLFSAAPLLQGCFAPNGDITFEQISPFAGPGSLLGNFMAPGEMPFFLGFGSHGMAIDSQGRILVAGFTNSSGTHQFAVARFLSNGGFDPSFGAGGMTSYSYVTGANEKACSVIVDPFDQSIIIGGISEQESGGVRTRATVLQKLTIDGQISNAIHFGNNSANFSQYVLYDGSWPSNIGNDDDACVSLANVPSPSGTSSGGYLAAYSLPDSVNPEVLDFAAMRIRDLSNTTPVPLIESPAVDSINIAYEMQLFPQPLGDGTYRAVVLGISKDNNSNPLVSWALSVPAGFTGLSTSSVSSLRIFPDVTQSDIPRAALFDNQGDLLVTGYSENAALDTHSYFLVRLKATANFGAMDYFFGNHGFVLNPFPVKDFGGFALALDSQFRILVGGGYSRPNTGLDQVLLRYLPNGELDSSFGANGGYSTNMISSGDDVITGIYVDTSENRILTAGFGNGNQQDGDDGSDGTWVLSAFRP